MTERRCPWCSASLPVEVVERCPSCGASLVEPGGDLPGLTHVDPDALRPGRQVTAKPRGILGFLSGEYEAAEASAPEGALAPPPEEVRREMLRMELAAAEAELAASEAIARLEAEAAAEEAGTKTEADPGAGTASDAPDGSTGGEAGTRDPSA